MLLAYVKRSFYNTACYSISSLVVRFVGFLFLPYFVKKLSLADFGIWDFYQLFFSTGILLISSCAATSMSRYYFVYKDDLEKQQQAIGNSLLGVIVLSGTVFVVGYAALYYVFGRIPRVDDYAYVTLLNISCFALFSVMIAYLRMREYFVWYFSCFSGQALLATTLTFIGVRYGFGITSFFYANLISYICFLPIFIYLVKKYHTFSFPVLKQQLSYGLPLLVNAMLYTGFFSIDRLVIKQTVGYELLGKYALLWRFGALFQFFSIALLSAWNLVIFNAQNEENNTFLINRLMVYFCLALTTASLGAMIVSRCAIGWIFPYKHHNIILYLPLFFISLAMLGIARLLQSGFILALRTLYVPCLTSFCLAAQFLLLLWMISGFGLWGIFVANTITFFVYAFVAYTFSTRVYAPRIVNVSRIAKIMICFFTYAFGVYVLLLYAVKWYCLMLFGCTWPAAIWSSGIIEEDEKIMVKGFVQFLLARGWGKRV